MAMDHDKQRISLLRHAAIIFAVLAALFGLIRTAYLFLNGGTWFFVAVILSLLLALCALFEALKREWRRLLKELAGQQLDSILSHVDADAAARLVRIAEDTRMPNEVAHFISRKICVRSDSTERYWIYVPLGKIGGRRARAAIKKGLNDENEFAKSGAEAAWESLQRTEQRGKIKDKIFRHRRLLLYILALLLLCAIVATISYMLFSAEGNGPPPPPEPAGRTIRIEWRDKGDIWIYLFNDKGHSATFGIRPGSPPPSRYLQIQM